MKRIALILIFGFFALNNHSIFADDQNISNEELIRRGNEIIQYMKETENDFDSKNIEGLIKRTKDPNPQYRSMAVNYLGKITNSDATVVPAITALLNDDDVQVRFSAVQALRSFGKKATPATDSLIAYLQSGRERGRDSRGAIYNHSPEIIDSLKQIGNSAALAAVASYQEAHLGAGPSVDMRSGSGGDKKFTSGNGELEICLSQVKMFFTEGNNIHIIGLGNSVLLGSGPMEPSDLSFDVSVPANDPKIQTVQNTRLRASQVTPLCMSGRGISEIVTNPGDHFPTGLFKLDSIKTCQIKEK